MWSSRVQYQSFALGAPSGPVLGFAGGAGGFSSFSTALQAPQSYPMPALAGPPVAPVAIPAYESASVDSDTDRIVGGVQYSTTPVPDAHTTERTWPWPWLKDALSANRTLTVAQGTFELGEHLTEPFPEVACNSSLLRPGNEGLCVPISACPQAETKIQSITEYLNYFCPLDNDKVAGICCYPKQVLLP